MSKVTTLLAAIAVLFCFAPNASADLDNLDIGGDVKVMGVYTENTVLFDDDSVDQDDFLRLEAHLWFQADLSDNVTAKISLEVDRDMETALLEPSGYLDVEVNDLGVYLEEAWVQMAYMYDSAISMKLGRQFIELGDGFIVGDANPFFPIAMTQLGEWEVSPFDAINVWYDGDDWMLTGIFAKVTEERTLDNMTNIGDTDMYALYFSYNGWEDYVWDLYGLLVDMNGVPTMAALANQYLGLGLPNNLDANVYAIGTRFAGSPWDGWKFKVEGVYEFGKIDTIGDEMDIKAWAVEAGLNYTWDSEYQPMIGLTYVYKSGDDDGDSDFETYLSLFENRTYGEIFETYARLGNLHVFNLYGGFNLSEDVAVSMKYYYFMADRNYNAKTKSVTNSTLSVDSKFTEEVAAMFAAGLFMPEDAVEEVFGEDDMAWFARAGVKVEF
jgi:hypothetical protein